MHDEDIKSKLPDQFREDDSPAVVFNLTNTIRNKILNYKDTVSNIEVNDSESYGTGLRSCNCSSSDFVDQHHGHVLTGDLRIIENVHLRQLIQKGPNYREPKPVNWKKCRDTIKSGLDTCADNMVGGKDIPVEQMNPWKSCSADSWQQKQIGKHRACASNKHGRRTEWFTTPRVAIFPINLRAFGCTFDRSCGEVTGAQEGNQVRIDG